MFILGLNQYHGDSSAALIKDGKVIAAVEEERFNRLKHWSGFPKQSIEFCLKQAGISPYELSAICTNRAPNANIVRKLFFVLRNKVGASLIFDRLRNRNKIRSIKDEFCGQLNLEAVRFTTPFIGIEHHRAHMASSFLTSPFKEAAVLSIDGFGDFCSTMTGFGSNNKITSLSSVYFPHSLGVFYLACTQYLGFYNYGDEYKVMGLSAYGKPLYLDKMHNIVLVKSNELFSLNMEMFAHHKGFEMSWNNTIPVIGKVFSGKMEDLLGPSRIPGEPIGQHHIDIAASVQAMYEEAFFCLLSYLYIRTRSITLCLAGGCALNSLANGKIFERSPFKKLYIQPAAGDAGGAIGAALYYYNCIVHKERGPEIDHAYFGPEYTDKEIRGLLKENDISLQSQDIKIELVEDEKKLCSLSASEVAQGKVLGWFQGRMEWGPRALGNRSIICDPRRADMKDILNTKIKRRELFRPFAPSIHRDAVGDFFETEYDVPFMQQVFKIREEKRKLIPAVTHVDGTGRLQTVTKQQNPLYWLLIEEFRKITEIPMVLNTSFNENEPIVCRPAEALNCFLRTKMDLLVLGNYMLSRSCGKEEISK